ncbi:MAG: SDR family oxidoreductase [Ignavibacteriales bacterium]
MRKELLIFGAGGDLGRGVTQVFLNKDYDYIYLFDRTVSKIALHGDNLRIIETGDLSVEENVSHIFSNISPDKNTLFFQFSTIGGFRAGTSIWETPLKQWDLMMKMNLYSAFLLAKYFSLLVKESAGGSVCFTSSMTGNNPESKKASYGVSKNALNFLVKTLALEGREIGLSANAVAPGIIDTPENRGWVKNASAMVSPEQIGELVYSVFCNYKTSSGNVINMPGNLQI